MARSRLGGNGSPFADARSHEGGVRVPRGRPHRGGLDLRVHRNRKGADGVWVKGGIVPRAVPRRRPGGTGSFAEAPALPLTTAPECENDIEGRFTIRPSGNAQGPSRLSARAARSCGLAARPPVAGQAAQAVAGATLAEVRARGGVEMRTLAPALPGSLPTINPWREGSSSTASRRWGSRSPTARLSAGNV